MEKLTLEEITRIAEKLGVKMEGAPTPEQKAEIANPSAGAARRTRGAPTPDEIANLLVSLLEIESKLKKN